MDTVAELSSGTENIESEICASLKKILFTNLVPSNANSVAFSTIRLATETSFTIAWNNNSSLDGKLKYSSL